MTGDVVVSDSKARMLKEINILIQERDEARKLASIMYNVLGQFPTSPDEYDDKLAHENLPGWIHVR